MLPIVNELKKKQPCQTPGCDYPNFHICLVGKPDTFPKLLKEEERKALGRRRGPRYMSPRSSLHIENIRAAAQERWNRVHKANEARDKRIVTFYESRTIGVNAVAAHFGIGRDKVMAILKRAEEVEDRTIVRPPGRTLAHGAE